MATKEEKLKRIEESLARAREQTAVIGEGVEQLAIEKERPKVAAEARRITAGLQTLSVDQLQETGDFKIPEQEVEQKDITIANGFLAKQKQAAEDEVARVEQERKDEEARIAAEETEKKSFLEKLFPHTKEEKIRAEQEELGIDPVAYLAERKADIAELDALWTSYNDKVAQRDDAVARNEGTVGVSLDYQTAEGRRITNKYNVEINRMAAGINSKSAIMAQKQGLMNEARSFAKEAVDAYVYDKRLAYDQFEAFEDENQDALDDLADEHKTALAETKALSFEIWKQEEAEKTSVMGLMLQSPTAGIAIEDTLAEATQKASIAAAAVQDISTQIIGSAERGYSIVRINNRTGQLLSTTPIAGTGAGGQFTDKENQNIAGWLDQLLRNPDGSPRTEEESRNALSTSKAIIISQFGDKGQIAFDAIQNGLDATFAQVIQAEIPSPIRTFEEVFGPQPLPPSLISPLGETLDRTTGLPGATTETLFTLPSDLNQLVGPDTLGTISKEGVFIMTDENQSFLDTLFKGQ